MAYVLAPKWTPRGVAQRFTAIIGGPRNSALFLHVGWFIASAPAKMARRELSSFVRGLREGVYPRAGRETLRRISAFWLVRVFPKHNTCYVRSMLLYRFLDVSGSRLRLHLGIEHRADARERLRGHAWVSNDGVIIDGPPVVHAGAIREIVLNRES